MQVIRLIAFVVGGLVLLVALYVACILVRKNAPFVLRSDIEQLAASGLYNSQELATEFCGTEVDLLGAPDNDWPMTAFPRAKLLSWRPILPMEGTASVRVVGVGVSRLTSKAITQPCEATITFKYRFAWVDNGRSVNLHSDFIEVPKIVRQ